jgi:hypothetical protein
MQFMILFRRDTERFADADFAPRLEEEAERARALYAAGFIRQGRAVWRRRTARRRCVRPSPLCRW